MAWKPVKRWKQESGWWAYSPEVRALLEKEGPATVGTWMFFERRALASGWRNQRFRTFWMMNGRKNLMSSLKYNFKRDILNPC